jgi:hypothetical protein
VFSATGVDGGGAVALPQFPQEAAPSFRAAPQLLQYAIRSPFGFGNGCWEGSAATQKRLFGTFMVTDFNLEMKLSRHRSI